MIMRLDCRPLLDGTPLVGGGQRISDDDLTPTYISSRRIVCFCQVVTGSIGGKEYLRPDIAVKCRICDISAKPGRSIFHISRRNVTRTPVFVLGVRSLKCLSRNLIQECDNGPRKPLKTWNATSRGEIG